MIKYNLSRNSGTLVTNGKFIEKTPGPPVKGWQGSAVSPPPAALYPQQPITRPEWAAWMLLADKASLLMPV